MHLRTALTAEVWPLPAIAVSYLGGMSHRRNVTSFETSCAVRMSQQADTNSKQSVLAKILTLQPSGHYMYHRFNIQQFYVLPTQCIYVFCVDLSTNSDYFPIQH